MAPKTVLITGCSEGGLGAALAIEMAKAGWKVMGTARNLSKMSSLPSSIERLSLEVTSQASIKKCVEEVRKITGGQLNMLINNAGIRTVSPIIDLDIEEGKRVFDTNVWAQIAVTQAFMPLLLNAKQNGGQAWIVNQTSVAGCGGPPLQSTYNASKAAFISFSMNLRQELAPFGVGVTDLRTAAVTSDVYRVADKKGSPSVIKKGSLYECASDAIDAFNTGDTIHDTEIPTVDWAKQVSAALNKKNPPKVFWSGGYANVMWLAQYLPESLFESMLFQLTGLDKVFKWAKANPSKVVLE